MNQEKNQSLFLALSFLLFSYFIYWNSFKIPYYLDDQHMIVLNGYIKHFRHWPLFFKGYVTSCPIYKGMVRPLLMMTFTANYAMTRLDPWSYHLVNIFLHFLMALTLVELLKLIAPGKNFIFLALTGLLFLAHPLHNETVNYISCRSDLLVTLCMALGMASYVKKRYFLTVFWYLLALGSKENALCLPLLITAYELIYGGINTDQLKKFFNSRKGICIFSLFLISVLYWWYRQTYFSAPAHPYTRTRFENMLTQSGVTFFYLKMFFLPHPLSLAHDFKILSSLFDSRALFPVIGMGSLVALPLFLRKKEPLISFGLAWFVICLIPKFYARLNFVACEHHFYLSSLGLFMTLYGLLLKVPRRFVRLVIYAGAIILVVFTFLAWDRNAEWSDSFYFWKSQVSRNPGSALSHVNLASLYEERGENNLARDELIRAQATAVIPHARKVAKINLARLYHLQGDNERALSMLEGYVDEQPIVANSHVILGSVYLALGREEKALECFIKETEIFSKFERGFLALGKYYYFQAKDREKAEMYLIKALILNPDLITPYYLLGHINEQKGELGRALDLYSRAVKNAPGLAESNYYLGSLLVKIKDPRGIDYIKKALKINPGYGAALNDLAVAYASMDPPQMGLAQKFSDLAQKEGFAVSPDFLKLLQDHNPPAGE